MNKIQYGVLFVEISKFDKKGIFLTNMCLVV